MTTPIVITALPAGSALGGTEAVPVVQTGVTVQVPASYFTAGTQPSNATLSALAALATTGLIARTGSGTAATRTVTGTASQITVTNGDGVSGNPTLALASGIVTPGTYQSVTFDTYGRATAGTNPTTLAGYGITDAQPLNANLTALAGLTAGQKNELVALAGASTTGSVHRTGTATYVQRTLTGTASQITVTNGDGVSGNPTIALTSGILASPGTYKSVTADTYGRITAGTNPTTLAGYGITDAQGLSSELTAVAALSTTGLISRTGSASYIPRTLTAGTNITITNGDGISGNPTINATAAGLTINTQSTTYTIVAGDKGNIVKFTGSADTTFALTAAATLGAGWYCYVWQQTSDDTKILTLDPNASELIDGVTTIKDGLGALRLVQCDGSAFTTTLLTGGFIRFTASGSFIEPSRITSKLVHAYGGGGGGGGGSVGGVLTGGAGGGGGAFVFKQLTSFAVNTATTTTVGSIGTGGAANVAGGAGGNTSFGTYVNAYGGGGGQHGNATSGSNVSGASGGGATSAGGGAAGLSAGGGPNVVVGATTLGSTAGSLNNIGFGGGGSDNSGSNGGATEFGGSGGGGGFPSGTGRSAGQSVFGTTGGGGGGGNITSTGGVGGGVGYGTGGGAAGGTIGNPGTAGASSTTGPGLGGGGGGGSATTAGAGGAGGTPGGGGGAGGCGGSVGGAGANGGRGEIRVWYW